ncbi:MAG: hypothetical protein WAL77_03735 [Candidatus Dormiibacterota bacterium]
MIAAAATPSSDSAWSWTAAPILIAAISLVGIALAAALSRWGDATNRRRTSYASAVETMVAWVEFPYRIRRRTSDAPEELARLADIGHGLQERLSCHAVWIGAECLALGEHYQQALVSIGQLVGAACNEAWRTPPIGSAADMVIGEWGPGRECRSIINEFQRAVFWRFGVRRPVAVLRRLVRRSPYERNPGQVGSAEHEG